MNSLTTNTQASMKPAWVALGICCLSMIATMFLRSCPAILAIDLQNTFNVSTTEVALFSSATLLGYGIMQMPSGLITDAIGGRKALALFLLLAAASTTAFALSPSYNVAVGARFVKGLTLAAVPPAMTIISRYFPRERQTQAMGIFMGTSGLGTLLAAEPLARLSIATGWRAAMSIVAFLVMLLGIAVLIIIKEKGQTTAAANSSNSVNAGSSAGNTPLPSPALAEKLRAIGANTKKVLKTRQFWFLAIWQVCTASTFFAFVTMWAGPYLIEGFGLSKIEASRILLLQGICALVLIPLTGTIADKIGSRKIVLVACSALGLCGSAMLALFTGQLSTPLTITALTLISSFSTSGATCSMSLISRNFPKQMTGTGIGCVNMIWPLVASLVGVIIGLLLEFNTNRLGATAGVTGPQLSAAYGSTMFLFVFMWSCALVMAVFFIKEHFTVSGE